MGPFVVGGAGSGCICTRVCHKYLVFIGLRQCSSIIIVEGKNESHGLEGKMDCVYIQRMRTKAIIE